MVTPEAREVFITRSKVIGAMRGKKVLTTNPDAAQPCPDDKVNRIFVAQMPNQLWVSDFTYVSSWQGMVYVAFVIDVFARKIVGWRVSTSMTTVFVLDALNQAICQRAPSEADKLIHHSDRGSQYLSIRYTERLAEAGIDTSVGSVGDSYDNALAESIIGLFKTEVINFLGPWKSMAQVEWETLQWVSWYNNERLHSAIGHRPPQEVEEAFYEQMNTLEKAAEVLNKQPSRKPGAVHWPRGAQTRRRIGFSAIRCSSVAKTSLTAPGWRAASSATASARFYGMARPSRQASAKMLVLI